MMQNNAIAFEANLIVELCNRWVFKLSGDSRSLGVYAWDSEPVRQEKEAFCMNPSLHAGFKGGGVSVCWLNEAS